MTGLILAALLSVIPVEERYGGVIATLGPVDQNQVDGMMDKVCGGKKQWKLWKVTQQDQSKLPPQLRGMKSNDFRFYCLPIRKFVPDKK